MTESSLADLVPLWRTLRECEVTALVTPALDYVGGLELGTLDMRYAGSEQLQTLGEGLRSFLGSLEDECTLHFLYRVQEESEEDIRDYEAVVAGASPAPLKRYVASRASWLRGQRVRRTRLYLFFAAGGPAKGALSRGYLGTRLVFSSLASPAKASQEAHARQLKRLAQLRDRLSARLQHLGVGSRELCVQDIQQLHYELLNPERAAARLGSPQLVLQDDLFSKETRRRLGPHAAEYSEAEQLVLEDLADQAGHFRQGRVFRRVVTLRSCPRAAPTTAPASLSSAWQRWARRAPSRSATPSRSRSTSCRRAGRAGS